MISLLVELLLLLGVSAALVCLGRWRERSKLFRGWAWVSLPVLWATYLFWKVIDGSPVYPALMGVISALAGLAGLIKQLVVRGQIERAAEERQALTRRRDELRSLLGVKTASSPPDERTVR